MREFAVYNMTLDFIDRKQEDFEKTKGTITGENTATAWADTTTEITLSFFNLEGDDIVFRHASDNRGAIWKFTLNNNPIDTIIVDTYRNRIVTGKQCHHLQD